MEKLESVLSYFKSLVDNREDIEKDFEYKQVEIDVQIGICGNVCENTLDHSEKILQALFRKYFDIPACYYVPDYPFGLTDEPEVEYKNTPNLYENTEYGNQRWTFIEWAIKELEENSASYIDD